MSYDFILLLRSTVKVETLECCLTFTAFVYVIGLLPIFIDGCRALIILKHTGLRNHLGVIIGLGGGITGIFPFDYIH